MKGTGFPLEERQILGIHGLLPPTLGNQELQAQRIMLQLSRKESDLHKYLDLMALLQRNERLFYRVLMDNLVELMPVVYTPTVGKACQKYGEIFTSPKYVSCKIIFFWMLLCVQICTISYVVMLRHVVGLI